MKPVPTATPLAALLALLMGAAVVPLADAAELTKLAVSYSATADFAPDFVAKDAGIFAQHGLDVTLTNLATTSLGPPALMAGSLQIASSSPPLLLLANDGGMDLVAVAGVGAIDARTPNSSLVTRPGFTATQAQDLIGKKIGRPGINSAMDLVLKKFLIDRGVALDRVILVEVPFPQMGDFLRAGQIDAAFEIEPLRTRVIESGAGQKSIDVFSETNPHVVASIYAASRSWAETHRAALGDFRAALADAIAYISDHPDEAKDLQRHYIGSAGAPSSLQLDLHPADFDFWIATLNQLKLLQQPPPPTATLIIQ